MGKRNKKNKTSVAEAKNTVSKTPTTAAATEVSKNGNAAKPKRTKDSERLKCPSYYYVAIVIAVIGILAIFAIPDIFTFLGISERPSYRLLTPYAEINTVKEGHQPVEDSETEIEEIDATSATAYKRAAEDDESHHKRYETPLEDTNPTRNEDTSTLDDSKHEDHNNEGGGKQVELQSADKTKEGANENDDIFDVVRSETYDAIIEEKEILDDTSTSTTQQEDFACDQGSDGEVEAIPEDNSNGGSDIKSNKHLGHEVLEETFEQTEREQIVYQENDSEESDEGKDKAEKSEVIGTTSEDDSSEIAQDDEASGSEELKSVDEDKRISSHEFNEAEDGDHMKDNVRLASEINKHTELNDDSLEQTNRDAAQTDENDDATSEAISKIMDSHQDDNGLETASSSLADTNKDATTVVDTDDVAPEALSGILNTNLDGIDSETVGANLQDQETEDYLNRHEKEKIEKDETPHPPVDEHAAVSASKERRNDPKVHVHSEETESRSDPVTKSRQERESEAVELESAEPPVESDNSSVDDDDDVEDEDEDEDEDEEDEVDVILTTTKDETTNEKKENINDMFSQSLETDSSDSDENYMDVSKGVRKRILKMGTGEKIDAGDMITIHCIGYLDEDPPKKFWSTKDPSQRAFTFAVGKRQVIKGWDEGALSMTLNERSRIKIEPKKAYGKFGFEAWGIPPNARIIFEIEVIKHKRMKTR